MSRKTDLETHIRESYDLIRQYEEVVQVSENPNEKKRAEREMTRQRQLINGYLAEYGRIIAGSKDTVPEDIGEVATALGVTLPVAPKTPEQATAAQKTEEHIAAPEAPSPQGGQPSPSMRRFALLIGIGAYTNVRPLNKTVTDASDIHSLLLTHGYEAGKCRVLLDKSATKAAISDALDQLARAVGPDDSVLLFFSGHGARRVGGFEPGEYLCPVEANWYNLRGTAISTDELTTAVRSLKARHLFIFLDACHSGGVGEPKDIGGDTIPGLSDTTYERLAAGKGRVVIASCQPDEVSWELPGMRNGLFTNYLLEGLRGAAAEDDGMVRVFKLFDYLSLQVPKHKPQHPHFKGDLDRNLAIVEIKTPA